MKGSKRGFSLVELLVASFVLAVSITAFFTLRSQEMHSAHSLRDRAQAFAVARNHIRLIQAMADKSSLEDSAFEREDGSYLLPANQIVNYELAQGDALKAWMKEREAEVSIIWFPSEHISHLGTVTSKVTYQPVNKKTGKKTIELPMVLPL